MLIRTGGFYFHNNEESVSVLYGFTIKNGYAYYNYSGGYTGSGGGISCEQSNPIITNCVITNNTAAHRGGGIYCDNSSPTIFNCVIRENKAHYDGGGLGLHRFNGPIASCTIAGNSAEGYGGGLYNLNSVGDAEVTNCIIWGNTANGPQIYNGWASLTTVNYSDVQGGYTGTGNIDVDPLFALGHWDPNGTPSDPNDDFWVYDDCHLKSRAGRWDPNTQAWVKDDVTSPCIDAGDPNYFTGELWPHGKRINMGAYGGTSEASMSLSDVGNIADLNEDGEVETEDLRLFGSDWLREEVLLKSDLDRNGRVDLRDFSIKAFNWLWAEQ